MAGNISAGYDTSKTLGALVMPQWFSGSTDGSVFEEDPDSPQVELADQGTFTHKYTGNWESVKARIVPRGTYLQDSIGNTFRVLSCEISKQTGEAGRMTLKTESVSFAVPPDEFDDDVQEFNPALQKHPRYYVDPPDGNHLSDIDIQNVLAALELPQEAARVEAASLAAQSSNPALFTELLTKLRRGETTYYLAGAKLVWSSYYATIQPKDPGGYIQDPTELLPQQFYLGQGFLGNVPEAINTLPAGWSWLRLSDERHFNRTWFKHTRTWLGGPAGHWDAQVYVRV